MIIKGIVEHEIIDGRANTLVVQKITHNSAVETCFATKPRNMETKRKHVSFHEKRQLTQLILKLKWQLETFFSWGGRGGRGHGEKDFVTS